jgi:hypothetical protein
VSRGPDAAGQTSERDDRRHLTLLVRAYCHLCDDMRDALAPLAAKFAWTVDEFDIDADATLEKRWSDSVPVLLAGDRELCRYRLDEVAVTAFISGDEASKSR